jgi:hypothetical protein
VCGAPLPEHGAASIPGSEKNSCGAAGLTTGGIQKTFRKRAQPVIATHTMKTVINSNQASSLSHPATRLSRPFSCTPSLAHAAAQRSF